MKNTLNVVVIKYRDTGELRDWKRSGHLRKTTPCDDNTIRWIVMHFRRSSCTKIKACLHSKGVPDISISTVSWHLSKGFGLKSYKPAHKKRLEFAKRHQLWTAQNWNPMPFSDESTVHQFILRETHVRWVKGSMKNILLAPWDSAESDDMDTMLASGTASLSFLLRGTTMTGALYVEMLCDKLVAHIQICMCTDAQSLCMMVIKDSTGLPCHRSKTIQDYLKRNNIPMLDRTGNSHNLNPS